MKKLALIAAAFVVSAFAEGSFEKEGFLTTQSCADQGAFVDCYFENYICGSDGCFLTTEAGLVLEEPLVLFSHNDGVTYKLDTSALKRSSLDAGINRNAVTIIGEYDASTNTIAVTEFEAPPPPKKSFFKGCL